AKWEALCALEGDSALAAITDSYLSTRHRDHPGTGCIVTSVGGEAARHGPAVRGAFTEGVRSLLAVLARVAPGRTRAARREKALAAFAGMVGAIVLARAVDD